MSACEECWARAYTKSRMFGGSQVDRYQEELASHRHTDDVVAAIAQRSADPPHDRDRDGICRACGQGLTALDIVDGEKPCSAERGTR